MTGRLGTGLRILIALGFVGGLAWSLFRLILWLADFFRSLDSDVAKAIVAAGATVMASLVALIGSKAYEARLAVRQELRAKKTPVYESIVGTLYKLMFATMLSKPQMSEQEVKQFIAETTERLTIWGSDALLSQWGKWKTEAAANQDRALFGFEELLLAIRRDLGHRNWRIQRGTILRMFVTDIDDYLKQPRSRI
jgi:hypothetical protein